MWPDGEGRAGPTRKLWYLRQLNLFEGMTQDEIQLISQRLHERPSRRREVIYSCDTQTDRIFLLKEGRVRLYRVDADGHEVTTAMLLPGQLFGTSSLFGQADVAGLAEAVEDSYICEASTHEFILMMTAHPRLAAKVTMSLARQIFHLEQTVESLALHDVPSRLARLLLSLQEPGQSYQPTRGYPLPRSYTHEELARMIGSTRESVSRALSEFQRQGLVESMGRRIYLRDPDGLHQMARL